MAERKVTLEELNEHNKQGDLWLAIHGKVYDVSGFMDDHPGGGDVLLDCAGMDGTAEFEDIGHSESARQQMTSMLVGTFDGKFSSSGASSGSGSSGSGTSASSGSSSGMLVPLLVIGLAIAFFMFKDQILGGDAE